MFTRDISPYQQIVSKSATLDNEFKCNSSCIYIKVWSLAHLVFDVRVSSFMVDRALMMLHVCNVSPTSLPSTGRGLLELDLRSSAHCYCINPILLHYDSTTIEFILKRNEQYNRWFPKLVKIPKIILKNIILKINRINFLSFQIRF